MKKNYFVFVTLISALLFSSCASMKSTSVERDVNFLQETGAASNTAAGSEIYDVGSEEYLNIKENAEKSTVKDSLLTFSLKVDTASYNNIERYIQSGNLPPADAVRTEEMINYFNYDAEMQFGDEPFSIYTEVGPSPFDSNKHLAFVRVKSKDLPKDELPNSNLTFLIDTSGSMDSYDKLPLLKSSFKLLVDTLTEDDKVSIVTYAGSSAIILDSVSGADKETIINAMEQLSAGGSTAGADGILTAYKLAEKNYIASGNNRIILATDGDFNVGVSSIGDLEELISKKRDTGVYFSILGFGTGNLKDSTMETLSKNGNGNYSYINSVSSAKKVLVNELSSNLFTIADDVKAQVEFNPQNVKSYRLVGYENRTLNNEDFENDEKDAGEIGIGTDVVVIFEIEFEDGESPELKYSVPETSETDDAAFSDELFEVRIRYKNPGDAVSNLMTIPVSFDSVTEKNSSDFNFAASVAGFGHLLRNSEYMADATINNILSLAEDNMGPDKDNYRSQFVEMLLDYKKIANR